ncbi:Flp pilus assembly protein CpaB [bacterium J17]|nr:Flp pilus assembly protein CpaB [bacterium J17]
MATRFGASNPARAYQTKMRWFIACLICLCVLLIVSVFLISRSPATANSVDTPAPTPPVEVAAPTVKVLVAVKRIEEGAELREHMFDPRPWDPERLPAKAILSKDMARVRGKFAKHMIAANLPILEDSITEVRPVSALNIPPGYRAATIDVNNRSAVEGFAKPNTRVDVLWTYTGPDGRRKVSTIIRFAKVLSVGGVTSVEKSKAQVSGNTNVTLLVTERDAKKIELARTIGSLSLSLVGDQESVKKTEEPDTIDLYDLVQRPVVEGTEEIPNEGVMFSKDPQTGRQVKYVLRKGRWVKDKR